MTVATLKDQRVVIIGGSSGMGFAVAEGALAEGAKVVVASSDGAKVDAAVVRLGACAPGSISGGVIDVADESSAAAFFAGVGGFDHLVFTAGEVGFGRAPGPIAAFDFAAAKDGANVRFWGALVAVKHALGAISPTGSITLTDGVLAWLPRKGMPLTTAFAGAVEHLVKGLAVDLAPIRVNGVCPGLVMTERLVGWAPEMIQQMTARLPLPRAAAPEEAAQAFLYLMKGGYTTGQVMVVDGGATLV